jgi:hypothetical protein
MLDLAKDKFQTTKDRVRHRAAFIKLEAEAKIVSLQEHAAKADGRIKARLERLANEVRVDYVNRATTLNLARQIGREGRSNQSFVVAAGVQWTSLICLPVSSAASQAAIWRGRL